MKRANIQAVFGKQLKDTVRNKAVLIQFVMFPLLAVIMENLLDIKDIPEHFFATMFSAMFVGMAPLISMASLLAEEKEKNTLRVLMMSGVKPAEYLLGEGLYVFTMCLGGTAIFAALCGYKGGQLAAYFGTMAAGLIVSVMIGVVIGICTNGQMAATSAAVPATMVFSFLPMLSAYNETIRKFARITYSQQISELIKSIGVSGVKAENVTVIALNLAVMLLLFAFAFRRKGLE